MKLVVIFVFPCSAHAPNQNDAYEQPEVPLAHAGDGEAEEDENPQGEGKSSRGGGYGVLVGVLLKEL